MLRAPVLMKSIRNGPRNIRKNFRKFSISMRDGQVNGSHARSRSVCGRATELSVLITIKDRKSKTDEGVLYKDDEDRFRQR